MGPIKLEDNYTAYDLDLIETNPVRCPDPEKAKEMEELIFKIKGEGDTIGGVVTCVVKGCPIGLGQPIYGSSNPPSPQVCSASMLPKHLNTAKDSKD